MASGVDHALAPGEWASRPSSASYVGPTVRELADVVMAVSLAALGLALLTTSIVLPTVFGDELSYWDAARSMADGNGLAIREAGYGYGPVYPLLLAPVLRMASTPEAYAIAKLLNAALFASAAVPIYLLSRRLVDHGWSLVIAMLCLVAPAGVYTGFILTESAAFAAASWAFFALVLTLEVPTRGRQLLALLAIAVASAVRPQLVVLGIALIAAYLSQALSHSWLSRRAYLRLLAPTGIVLVLVLTALGVRAALDGSAVLGAYSVLASAHFPLAESVIWTWWTLGGITLALATVPVVVLGAVLNLLRAQSRAGSRIHHAFLLALVWTSAAVLCSIGLFSSSTWGNGILHERYVFYLVPLWLVAVGVWAQSGRRASRGELLVGASLAALLVATLPPGLRRPHGTVWLEWPSIAPWSLLDIFVPLKSPAFSVGMALALVTAALIGVRAARRDPRLVLVPIALAFIAATTVAWSWRSVVSHIDEAESGANSGVSWVDSAVGRSSSVTTLSPGSSECSELRWVRSMLYTEFANASVGRALHMRDPLAPVIASTRVSVGKRGFLVTDGGRHVGAEFVLAPKGVPLAGSRVASAPDNLVDLWAVNGPIRIQGASSTADVLRSACPLNASR